MEAQEVKVKSTASRVKAEARKKMSQGSANPAMNPVSPPDPAQVKPVAKIASSSEDSSGYWKALSEAQGKPLRAPPLTYGHSKTGDDGKQTGITAQSQNGAKRKRRKMKKAKKVDATSQLRKLPAEGLNSFGFFNYTHYGVLLTPILPAHNEFMVDTGILAMDCEMVGVGPTKESALARISIVNKYGYCLYDKFVKPKVEVTDYRTEFGGIRKADLRNATPFETVRKEVSNLIKSHILVGHSLKHDFAVLNFTHPKARTRDTADFFKKILHTKNPALRTLVKKILGVEIQQGEHSSIIGAQAAMALYRICQKDWEHYVRQKNGGVDILKQTLDEFKAGALPAQCRCCTVATWSLILLVQLVIYLLLFILIE